MNIGIDLTPLQGPHRKRGIGYTIINVLNNIPDSIASKHHLTFFIDGDTEAINPLTLFDSQRLDYEIRHITPIKGSALVLPGRLNLLMRGYDKIAGLMRRRKGDPRITDTDGLDAYLQLDQMVSLPAGDFKKAFVAYDLIPYVLEGDYLWDYSTARRHDLPLQAAIRCSLRRWEYRYKLRNNARQADALFAISKTTEADFHKYIPESRRKLITTVLGVDDRTAGRTAAEPPAMHRFMPSSWGYHKRPYSFDDKTRYLLFVGGADKRRRLEDLVTAFNHLRGEGHDVKLVLAGDSMEGPRNISTEIIQYALRDSSYLEDIVFMGFVNDEQRDWLYSNALAFVFPSVYEGFGLPVLEAMTYGCPVIAYGNKATLEVAEKTVLLAHDYTGIVAHAKALLADPAMGDKLSVAGKRQAARFSWHDTASTMFEHLIDSN